MGFDEVMKSVWEKLKEAVLAVPKWGAESLAWFEGLFPPDTGGEKIKHWFHVAQLYLVEMRFDEVIRSVREKLKEALLAMENWGAEALAWFDGVFPPETRGEKIKQWFHVAQPYLIAAVVLTMVVYFCRCCGGRGGGGVKMMKAPGRNRRMPRRDFEIDPKGYFQKLRSHPGSEESKHWFHVAQPYLIAAVVLTMVVYFCRCCGGRDGGRGKMMKAPGRNLRIPRSHFEIDSKGYFQNLRYHPG
ncbi:hypothetical protein CDL12_16357 [Handroanthus impetiginosus]|uniref:Uncharacterized protein n=1 Tax=Handroanthus impetiginosus TaxID=429701 RepID=A0A2G9H0J7_9LAMI|nr:hypothetical protein CDL12_16357 [Handroanthus impetiginosus]